MSERSIPLDCCAPLVAPAFSDEEADATARLFAALSDPARVKIVNLLVTSGEPLCVCQLTGPLALSQPTVSHHMKKLFEAGLIEREQRGKWALFSLDEEALRKVAHLIDPDGHS